MRFFDLHCDTATRCFDEKLEIQNGPQEISLKKGRGLAAWAQCFAIFVGDNRRGEAAFQYYCDCVDFLRAETRKNSKQMAICRNFGELDAALGAKKCAGLLTVENAAVLGGKLENVEKLADDGVKAVSLTWNGENELGFGSGAGGRLKPFGRAAMAELARRGMVIDLSHLSDEGFDEVLEWCGGPVMASHSNLRALCGHPRNLTDRQFKALAARGGIVGVNLHVSFLAEEPKAANRARALFEHVDRMLEMGGERAVAFGSDFDGARMPAFCRDVSRIPALYSRCAARYGEALADRIFFKNAYDFFERSGRAGFPCPAAGAQNTEGPCK